MFSSRFSWFSAMQRRPPNRPCCIGPLTRRVPSAACWRRLICTSSSLPSPPLQTEYGEVEGQPFIPGAAAPPAAPPAAGRCGRWETSWSGAAGLLSLGCTPCCCLLGWGGTQRRRPPPPADLLRSPACALLRRAGRQARPAVAACAGRQVSAACCVGSGEGVQGRQPMPLLRCQLPVCLALERPTISARRQPSRAPPAAEPGRSGVSPCPAVCCRDRLAHELEDSTKVIG